MSYIDLGRKKVTAAADLTGLNTGNWTNVFDHATLGANVSQFECYHISAVNVPALATLVVYKGADVWSAVELFGDAEWDPAQPMPLAPADDVYLCWDQPASGTPPLCWMWLRYDPAVNPVT